jgi:hypothetical protein
MIWIVVAFVLLWILCPREQVHVEYRHTSYPPISVGAAPPKREPDPLPRIRVVRARCLPQQRSLLVEYDCYCGRRARRVTENWMAAGRGQREPVKCCGEVVVA